MSDDRNPNEWATTFGTTLTADDGFGYVQFEDEAGNPVPEVAQMGLPGHYSRGKAGFKGYLLRLENGGGVCVATWTDPPSDSVEGECGLTDGTAVLRMLPTQQVEAKGTTGIGGVCFGALDFSEGVPIYIARMGDVVAVGGVTIGPIVVSPATTTKTVSV
jgi:hypothetical protein